MDIELLVLQTLSQIPQRRYASLPALHTGLFKKEPRINRTEFILLTDHYNPLYSAAIEQEVIRLKLLNESDFQKAPPDIGVEILRTLPLIKQKEYITIAELARALAAINSKINLHTFTHKLNPKNSQYAPRIEAEIIRLGLLNEEYLKWIRTDRIFTNGISHIDMEAKIEKTLKQIPEENYGRLAPLDEKLHQAQPFFGKTAASNKARKNSKNYNSGVQKLFINKGLLDEDYLEKLEAKNTDEEIKKTIPLLAGNEYYTTSELYDALYDKNNKIVERSFRKRLQEGPYKNDEIIKMITEDFKLIKKDNLRKKKSSANSKIIDALYLLEKRIYNDMADLGRAMIIIDPSLSLNLITRKVNMLDKKHRSIDVMEKIIELNLISAEYFKKQFEILAAEKKATLQLVAKNEPNPRLIWKDPEPLVVGFSNITKQHSS